MGSSVILPTPGQPATGPDPNFKQGAIPNLVQFKFLGIDPPAAIYLQRDDVLVLEAVSQQGADSVTVNARILLPYAQYPGQPDTGPAGGVSVDALRGPGYVQTIQRTLQITAVRTAFTLAIPLLEGYLLSVSVTSANAATRGVTYVRAWLNRGAVNIVQPNAAYYLLADYVTQQQQASWPQGRIVPPTDGQGLVSTYTVGNPAAGADLTFTSNVSGRVRLAYFTAKLVTSAVAGNRVPAFQVLDGAANVVYTVQDTVAVPASTTITYSLAPGGTNVRGAGAPIFVTLPIPAPFIGVTSVGVKSLTQGILGGDQWSTIFAGTEEWLDAF